MAVQTPTTVRGIPADLWLEVKLEATRRRVPIGVVFTEILRDWLERKAAAERSREQRREPAAAMY